MRRLIILLIVLLVKYTCEDLNFGVRFHFIVTNFTLSYMYMYREIQPEYLIQSYAIFFLLLLLKKCENPLQLLFFSVFAFEVGLRA